MMQEKGWLGYRAAEALEARISQLPLVYRYDAMLRAGSDWLPH